MPCQKVAPSRLRLLGHARHLLGRQPQNRLDGFASDHVDDLIHGQAGLLHQLHHGQQHLPMAHQEFGQLPFVHLPLVIYGMVVSFHGGSPFCGLATPILCESEEQPPLNLQLWPGHRHEQR